MTFRLIMPTKQTTRFAPAAQLSAREINSTYTRISLLSFWKNIICSNRHRTTRHEHPPNNRLGKIDAKKEIGNFRKLSLTNSMGNGSNNVSYPSIAHGTYVDHESLQGKCVSSWPNRCERRKQRKQRKRYRISFAFGPSPRCEC